MSYMLLMDGEQPPAEYSTPAFHPTVPGQDWFIKGHRYRETSRTEGSDGDYSITLERADIEPLYSFIDAEES